MDFSKCIIERKDNMRYEHRVENPDITEAGLFLKKLIGNREPVFICIGTDRSTGDVLGPLVGDKLQKLGFKVYGTIDKLIHAGNLEDFINNLNVINDTVMVVIDAALTDKEERIGIITIEDTPLIPGIGVDKKFSEVGEISIKGIVNISMGNLNYFILQTTRLGFVMKLAKKIVQIILFALGVSEKYISEEVAV
jgi:putative sporulation protein YyaC